MSAEEKILPEGWYAKSISELCDNISLSNIKIKQKDYLPEGKYPVVDQGQDLIGGYYNDETLLIPNKPPYIVFGDHTKVKKYIPFNFIAGADGVKVLKAKSDIDPKFLYYILCSINLENKGYARHFQLLKKVDFYVPTLPTQQTIVSKIEELFSELDNGVAQLKTAQQQLNTYRQSVLKWAFEGRLTNKDVKDGELPEGWKWVKIEEVANVGTGATPLKGNSAYYGGDVPWVTSGALNEDFVRTATDYVTEKALNETNLKVYTKHTLLVALYGEGKTRGKCSELLIEACTNQAIAAINLDKHDIRVKPFLKYFLIKNYNDVRRMSSGGVQPNLNLGIIKRMQFPFPKIDEQEKIVDEIERRLSVADKLQETIDTALAQSESLRQSILKRAFEGKLVREEVKG